MNGYLLDTHVFLWWMGDQPRLREEVRFIIRAPQSDIYLSIASSWELSIKASLGKLEVPEDLPGALTANDIKPLSITLVHTMDVRTLPMIHRDPFDRLIVAQARAEGLTLVTHDATLTRYDVPCLLT